MNENVQYASIVTQEQDGKQRAYYAGKYGVQTIERVPGTLTYEVHYGDGTMETHPSTEIVEIWHADPAKYGLESLAKYRRG